MHEYERDLHEVLRMRNLIDELREDLERMIRARDNDKDLRLGKIKKWSYSSMQLLSNTYISGIAAEATRLEEVLCPEELEIAEEVLNDIEELVGEFSDEELDEDDDGDDGESSYYKHM
jgi:hypothetical protein